MRFTHFSTRIVLVNSNIVLSVLIRGYQNGPFNILRCNSFRLFDVNVKAVVNVSQVRLFCLQYDVCVHACARAVRACVRASGVRASGLCLVALL